MSAPMPQPVHPQAAATSAVPSKQPAKKDAKPYFKGPLILTIVLCVIGALLTLLIYWWGDQATSYNAQTVKPRPNTDYSEWSDVTASVIWTIILLICGVFFAIRGWSYARGD